MRGDATAVTIAAAQRLASELPATTVEVLATAVETSRPGLVELRDAVQAAIAHPHYRAAALVFVDVWQGRAPELTVASVALALRTAAHCQAVSTATQRLDLVWTGPDVSDAYRHTEPALLDLIDHAKHRLTVVSFMTYKAPTVTAALAAAARRGVEVRLVIEDAEASQGKVATDALAAFGSDVARQARVFVWPADQRRKDTAGHHGSLHAKCAVADGSWLLISSANLTEYAFTLNIELGVLVRGGMLPARVERYVDHLIDAGILRMVGL